MFAFLTQNRGQAIVEYTLILSLVILLATGLLMPLHKGFEALGGGLFGPEGYFSCLLKTGLLPGQTASVQECKDLEEVYGDFQAHADRIQISDSGGGGSGAGQTFTPSPSSSTRDSESSSASTFPTTEGQGGGSGTGGGTSSSRRGAGAGSSSSASSRRGGLIPLRTDSGGGGKNRQSFEESSLKRQKRKGFKNFGGGGSSDSFQRGQVVGGYSSAGFMEQEAEEERERAPASFVTKKGPAGVSEKKQIIKVEAKKTKAPAPDEPWSFGSILRVLLIICFILVLVLIVGSQTFQVKKSMK